MRLAKEIDVIHFYRNRKKNYCIGNNNGILTLLVTHSSSDIRTMLSQSSSYQDLKKRNFCFEIFDKETHDSTPAVYVNRSFDLWDVKKPLIFDVDFEELFSWIRPIE